MTASSRYAPMRTWVVRDAYDQTHDIEAQFCFNNAGEGLVFRRYPPGSDRSEVVACFAAGSWHFYKETTSDGEE